MSTSLDLFRLSVMVAAVGFASGCGSDTAKAPGSKPSSTGKTTSSASAPASSGTAAKGGTDTAKSAAPVAEGWGNLTGRFVYEGTPPVPMKVSVTKDQEVCTKHHPVDETVVVSADGGLANAAVYLRTKRGDSVKVHPDYEATAADSVVLDNLHCRFDPHVAVLRTGQTLVLKNSDSVAHNTKGDCQINTGFNLLIPPGEKIDLDKAFVAEAEPLPFPVGCNVHPWMAGYVVLRDNPYMAVSAEDGTFTIKNLPSGEHEFQLWHEGSGYLNEAQVSAGGEVDKKGRLKITIQPGENDLGEIKVPASAFSG